MRTLLLTSLIAVLAACGASTPSTDAGEDAGDHHHVEHDAGPMDAGDTADAGAVDAGHTTDAGAVDAGASDAGTCAASGQACTVDGDCCSNHCHGTSCH